MSDDERRIRLFFRLLRESLREDEPTCLGDLIESVKCRAARARIPYGRGELIYAAIVRLAPNERISFASRPMTLPVRVRRDDRPLTRAEARSILAKLGAQQVLKAMPVGSL